MSQMFTGPKRAILALVVTSSVACIEHTRAVQFDISGVHGTQIVFTGAGNLLAQVSFTGLGQFQIDHVAGGTGSAAGYLGAISGVWTLGPPIPLTVDPLLETARITGAGTLSIFDGTDELTATLEWVEGRSRKAVQSVGKLGAPGNLTGVSYAGVDPDLLAYANALRTSAFLTYSFLPGQGFEDLVLSGTRITTFSAKLVAATGNPVPDAAATSALLGLGLLSLAALSCRCQRP
jgi:hypothetical protein